MFYLKFILFVFLMELVFVLSSMFARTLSMLLSFGWSELWFTNYHIGRGYRKGI